MNIWYNIIIEVYCYWGWLVIGFTSFLFGMYNMPPKELADYWDGSRHWVCHNNKPSSKCRNLSTHSWDQQNVRINLESFSYC